MRVRVCAAAGGLGACRVSVVWPVCVSGRERVRADTATPASRCRASASARCAARRGSSAARRASEPRPGVCPSARAAPAPAALAGLSAARPLRPHSRLDPSTDTRTLADIHPRGVTPPLQLQRPERRLRPRRPRSPRHRLGAPAAPPRPPAPLTTRVRVLPPLSRAHSTAGGKLTTGLAARGAQRPPAPARGLPRPGGSTSAGGPHFLTPSPAAGHWRSVTAAFPFLQERQLRLCERSDSPKVTQRAGSIAETPDLSTLVPGLLAAAHYLSPTASGCMARGVLGSAAAQRCFLRPSRPSATQATFKGVNTRGGQRGEVGDAERSSGF